MLCHFLVAEKKQIEWMNKCYCNHKGKLSCSFRDRVAPES